MPFKYLFVVPHAATQTPLSKFGLAVGQLLTHVVPSRFPLLQEATHCVPSKYGLSVGQLVTQVVPL